MRIPVILAGLAMIALSGCVFRHRHADGSVHTVIWWPGKGSVTSVHTQHVCTHACDHYWQDNQYYSVPRGHAHGPDCGHWWNGTRWVVVQRVKLHHKHVCNAHCGHYHHGNHVYHAHGHVHGPNCGHAHRGGRWVVVVK